MTVTRVLSRLTIRAKPVRGGKKTCSRCDALHMSGHAYCRTHKIEYDRAWRKKRRDAPSLQSRLASLLPMKEAEKPE